MALFVRQPVLRIPIVAALHICPPNYSTRLNMVQNKSRDPEPICFLTPNVRILVYIKIQPDK